MLSEAQRARYDRHLRLEGFGGRGQERLLESSVLVVGAGGLGSPALLYLAAAGVGRIGIVDDDVVDSSNLQRQVIHREGDVGSPKAQSAARAVRELNPGVTVESHYRRFDVRNARELVRRYDVVLDGADNFTTRYLANDAAFLESKPLVHGSVYRFEGQVTTFARGGGPCYRCLFPVPPPFGSMPSCVQAGVLGVLPGTIGMAQATEALKLLSGIGETLAGRLLRYDALAMSWDELRLPRDPNCPLCGDLPTITEIQVIESSCPPGEGVRRLSPAEYALLRDGEQEHLLLDVREPSEVAAGNIAGHRNIPMMELAGRMGELDGWRGRLVVCQCQRGGRSLEAAELLRQAGFTRVASLDGGYLAWRQTEGEG
jgi:molybdopterin/thiamine biosynthesis adenylyltransferase/rhodanese-related sulfurtransferase